MRVEHKTMKFGVIADTHIPDRARKLPECLLEFLRNAQIDGILHAGDASNWEVIHVLEQIAPVTVVQGNRDWLFRMKTPRYTKLNINGLQLIVTHGHRSMFHYLVDKWAYIRKGYLFERYYRQLSHDFPTSDVIIFGHTHHQTARWVNGQLLFNPGAAYPCLYNRFIPQFGILSITSEGVLRTECYDLKCEAPLSSV